MRRYQITIGGKSFEVEIQSVAGEQAQVMVNGRPYDVIFQPLSEAPRVTPSPIPPQPAPASNARLATPPPTLAPPPPPRPAEPSDRGGPGAVIAPMPGVILDVLVKVGDPVQVGDTVVKLEAMKMENDIKAPISGVVAEVLVNKGANVTVSEVLVMVTGS